MMATIKTSPTKHPTPNDPPGSEQEEEHRQDLLVRAHVVKHEPDPPDDDKMDTDEDRDIVPGRLAFPGSFDGRRHPHLSGDAATTASGTSGRSSSNSGVTSSPRSTPPATHDIVIKKEAQVSLASGVTPSLAVPLLLASHQVSRAQNISPGLASRPLAADRDESKPEKPSGNAGGEDKRINNNTASYINGGGRLKFFKEGRCLLELTHRSEDSTWIPIAKTWPPPGPTPAESSPSVHSVSEAGSDVAHSPLTAKKEEDLSPPSGWPYVRRTKSTPSKFTRQPQRVIQELCFSMNAPPCMVTIRRKTRNLKQHRRRPAQKIPMGPAMQALIRFESQAVKTRAPRRPVDLEKAKKKASRVLLDLATSAPLKSSKPAAASVARAKKPSSVIGPILPWKPSTSGGSNSSKVQVTTQSFSSQTVAKRVIKSETYHVTETCTAATMPPSSPSTGKHKKGGDGHGKMATPDRANRHSISSSNPTASHAALGITPMLAKVRHDPSSGQHALLNHSISLQSPDMHVKLEIGRDHNIYRAQTAHIPTASVLPESSFTSPRKRILKDAENSPSKRHRPSTGSRGSAGSSDGINSGTASPSLHMHLLNRGMSPGFPGMGVSPPRHQPAPRSSSFSIESLMGQKDERDSRPAPQGPIRPVAIPASPLRVSDIKKEHEVARTPSRSPISRPSPAQSQSPPPRMAPSPVNVTVTPYAERSRGRPQDIDPRLIYLAGGCADPSLNLKPTGGVVGSPFTPYNNPMAAAFAYMAAAASAASAANIWQNSQQGTNVSQTPHPPSSLPSRNPVTQAPNTPATPATIFSPWSSQYRGSPKPETPKQPGGIPEKGDTPLDLCIKRDS